MFKTNAFDLQAKPATEFVKILARTQIMKARLSKQKHPNSCPGLDYDYAVTNGMLQKNDNCKEHSGSA